MIDEKKVEKHYSQGSIIDLILGGIKSMGKTIKNINIYDFSRASSDKPIIIQWPAYFKATSVLYM